MRLRAEEISFKYNNNDKYILEDIDFSIESGEVVGLLAPSGYGKTTLAKILAGYEKPTSGQVVLEGCESRNNGCAPVQLIFQHPEKAVNPKWKMRKILSEAGMPPQELIDAMGIKESWMDRWPTELSGGELQRFCCIRVLSEQTKFIIADEMTTMLDAITQAQIWNVVLTYAKKHNIGVVVISHDACLINKVCDRVVSLTGDKRDVISPYIETIQISASC